MTGTEILLSRLERLRRRVKVLRDDNQRLWESREKWKARHVARNQEISVLRRRVKRLDESRLMWQARVPPSRPCRNIEPNVTLSPTDLQRILGMRPRD